MAAIVPRAGRWEANGLSEFSVGTRFLFTASNWTIRVVNRNLYVRASVGLSATAVVRAAVVTYLFAHIYDAYPKTRRIEKPKHIHDRIVIVYIYIYIT